MEIFEAANYASLSTFDIPLKFFLLDKFLCAYNFIRYGNIRRFFCFDYSAVISNKSKEDFGKLTAMR